MTMNTRIQKSGMALERQIAVSLLALIGLSLGACAIAGEGAVSVGIEPTPTPAVQTYSNSAYGFEFQYPETWDLTERPQQVVLHRDALSLGITFRLSTEELDPKLQRSGFPAGDLIYEGKLTFLGEVIPVDALLFELKYKALLFNSTAPLESDGLVFNIVLEDLFTEYAAVDIPEEVRQEAMDIVGSFTRIEATGQAANERGSVENLNAGPLCSAYEGFEIFMNTEHGFCFVFPAEMDRVDGANKVSLRDGSMTLEVSFRMADESVDLVAGGQLEGQFEPIGPFTLFGDEIPGFINTVDGRVKEVVFGNSSVEWMAGDLRLYIRFFDAASEDGFDPDRFTESLEDSISEILSSFIQFE
jgi:hypothetical protein